ncbi:MAG: ribosome-associated translation inhibitor RaiA [Acidobacteria bacterium]|nr:ribosome-associated translation inhibitor RaiA [Acidobacteriota bacterium]
MNIHYTGRQVEFSETQKKKLEAKFQKIQKIVGRRHEPEAHVIASLERRRHVAEVTLNFQHHTMVVQCAGSDLLAAVQEAVDKLEKQIVRNKDRRREKKRRARPEREVLSAPGANGGPAGGARGLPPILRTGTPAAKPLTVEEAVLEMEQDGRDCVVYQDAVRRRLSVLFRRRDGQLELIEA